MQVKIDDHTWILVKFHLRPRVRVLGPQMVVKSKRNLENFREIWVGDGIWAGWEMWNL